MASLLRKHHDRYLDGLAAEPLFRGVPRHLIVVVGRTVDPIRLEPGAALACRTRTETVLVAEGNLLVSDSHGRALAAVGPLGVIDGDVGDACRITAVSPVRAFVVARRELASLATIAPAVARALARAAVDDRMPSAAQKGVAAVSVSVGSGVEERSQ
jgi:hypothetical protein